MKDLNSLTSKLCFAAIIMLMIGLTYFGGYLNGYDGGERDTRIEMLMEQVEDANDRVDELLFREAAN